MLLVLLRYKRELLLWFRSRTNTKPVWSPILLVRVQVDRRQLLEFNPGLLRVQATDKKLHCKLTSFYSENQRNQEIIEEEILPEEDLPSDAIRKHLTIAYIGFASSMVALIPAFLIFIAPVHQMLNLLELDSHEPC